MKKTNGTWTPARRAASADRMRKQMSKPWGDSPERRAKASERMSRTIAAWWEETPKQRETQEMRRALKAQHTAWLQARATWRDARKAWQAAQDAWRLSKGMSTTPPPTTQPA